MATDNNTTTSQGAGQWDDFLNPKSMITPGVAGSLVMLLTNAICFNFGELQPRWVGLVLSGTVGFLVFLKGVTPLWQKIVFYLLNSLIIFSVGMGTANLAHSPAPQNGEKTANSNRSFLSALSGLFVSTANAQEIQTLSTNVLTIPSGPEHLLISVSNTDLQLSNADQILPAVATSNQIPPHFPKEVRVNDNELSKILAANKEMQARIKELEARDASVKSAKSTSQSQRAFFQKW